MKLIIEARLEGEDTDYQAVPVTLAVVERENHDITQLGLSLAEGRALLAAAQSSVVSCQASVWLDAETQCHRCHRPLRLKDSRPIVFRTVFGKVAVNSPRVWSCTCENAPGSFGRSVSPLSQALPKRVTPELEYLQVKWAAHLSYATATALLKEVLPLQTSISTSGTKNRIRAVGSQLDAAIESDIAATRPKAAVVGDAQESTRLTAVSVDSAWLKHCAPPRDNARQVNIVAGRATLVDGQSRLYAYVGKQVTSCAARLDQFLARQGVRPDERVTVISDGASEFETAVKGSQLARDRILDWFHIAMKFRSAQQSILGRRQHEGPDWDWIEHEIASAKWLVWHGKGRKAVARLQTINDKLSLWPQHEFSTLWWNVRKVCSYVRANERFLVNYGARYRKGLPISSIIAESAVNQVVSLRMAKKRQMRWSDEGAHLLVLVRVADLNGELSPQALAAQRQSVHVASLSRCLAMVPCPSRRSPRFWPLSAAV